MKLITSITAIAAAVSGAEAYWKGFNLAANKQDGACKTREDWENDFNRLKGLPGHFTSVRLYASSDCNTLQNAVPAALNTGIQILVGVWAQDSAHFTREKDALSAAIQQYGHDWIIAISVGSEDLYRKDIDPNQLAKQIYDVRGMVRNFGLSQEVGHVDTWTAWVDGANEVVITASDFVALDGYPYFEGSSIEDAANTFWTSVQRTRDVVNRVKSGTWVWVTETGWPYKGETFGGKAVASQQNAQTYWSNVACDAMNNMHFFYYIDVDYNQSPSFGVLDSNFNPIINLQC
ncbi:putative glucan endo-1,3-beta-glucosidase eglC [Pseudovirgaria hyperparasitica]|uniref:Probable glucan endo-1,3-beta-glucosidase eglC n=1 Tax=Pseudovirgaria hyperparasitica TaxID=470096 RepID=A0A6A6W9F3_9PEZI|nr:putative glucan endo-1,3-beta-glucosidase eglC [Pseudovirgaria hyperparasitica]KAF2757721.1 putative glucan endo-1,3-beta-glucosidase eglC [Pseudovirgaria hyperparasitica]